jgi:hypothetical protein
MFFYSVGYRYIFFFRSKKDNHYENEIMHENVAWLCTHILQICVCDNSPHTHTCTHTYTCIYIPIPSYHLLMQDYLKHDIHTHTCIHIYTYMHIHTDSMLFSTDAKLSKTCYTHTYMHTYIHIHAYTYRFQAIIY